MMGDKIRHLTYYDAVDGTRHWKFKPSKSMKAAGFVGETIGTDYAEARARVERFNAEWDEIKRGGEVVAEATPGSVRALFDTFQKDPVWYLAKSDRTREEIDYVFTHVLESFADVPLRLIKRKHLRAYYNKMRLDSSVHRAQKLMKWFKRALEYGVEIGAIDHNPGARMSIERPVGRHQRWTGDQVSAFIKKVADERPSLGLAVKIAYETSLPQQDIRALTWAQYDGEGLTVDQKKKRGGKTLWLPLSSDLRQMLDEARRTTSSTHVVVSEETGQPYEDRNVFSRQIRRWCKRAGITGVTFHDLRRTALTELGEKGATNAEIVSFSGHSINSRVLDTYVKPDRGAALRALEKRSAKEDA